MFRPAVGLLLSLSFALVCSAGKSGDFRARREALRKQNPEALIVVMGATEEEIGNLRSGFVQEPNFYYLSGWTEPGAALVIGPKLDVLLLPEPNEKRERYTGKKGSASDPGITDRTGFDRVVPITQLNGLKEEQERAGVRELTDTKEKIQKLRMIKSRGEIELIQRAADVSVEAHKAAWRRIAPGLREYQVAATMSNVYFEAGCERHAYPPIVASGPKAIILHYNENKRRMDGGELVLMDVGAECAMYAADITRTVPVDGKFSKRQREIYDAVLAAADAAIAAAKPGVTFARLNDIARERLRLAGSAKGGTTLDNYLTYFLGHGVGLQVHDPTDRQAPLEPGVIITIEPGVYIPEEGIGIRIEDMILITKDGARNMTAALPREATAIEKAMGARTKSHR
ncbi:MAG TPA: Xaa-Pro aminopeptidase [Bryobacteraceae bacterium]|nr:Xaa-Pro aminopeptidase [Bryobacteraceae bacterium]